MKLFTKVIVTLILILCIAAILGACALIGCYWFSYSQGSQVYENIQELAITPAESPDFSEPAEPEKHPYPTIDFEILREENPDVIGWIYIPDTRINYPIVKRLNDNDYYLSHLFDGTVNKSGSIFLDTRCSLEDEHILIHGHNMGDGSMFRDLNQFRSRKFLDAHPTFWILTPEKTYEVQILSGSILGLDSPVWQLDFPTAGSKQSWLSDCHDAAYIRTPVQPSTSDQIVTLSTCSYEFDQTRWILQGIMKSS